MSEVKGVLRDNRRHAAFDDYIVIPVFADILSVFNNSVDTVLVEGLTLRGTQSTAVQELTDGRI